MIRPRYLIALAVTGTVTFAAARPLWQDMPMPEPTPEHAMLQKGVGTWEGTVTMFMPGMPSEPVEATEVVTSAGPFWTLSDFESTLGPMPYHGHGCMGFDPESGKYKSTWIDNMSPFLTIMQGDYDADTSTMTTRWTAPDMMGQMAPHHAVQKLSENAYTMTFFVNDAKTMVIDMERTGSMPKEASMKER